MTTLVIRPFAEPDWPAVWALFRHVTLAGDAFVYDADTPEATARKLWVEPPSVGYVAESGGDLVGTYFVRPNQPGRGSHVANAGYMVAPAARGHGLAVTLCDHSLGVARALGFAAMQFNCVVSTNSGAVRAWERCGFAVVGRLPAAFRHDAVGLVDVFVMSRRL